MAHRKPPAWEKLVEQLKKDIGPAWKKFGLEFDRLSDIDKDAALSRIKNELCKLFDLAPGELMREVLGRQKATVDLTAKAVEQSRELHAINKANEVVLNMKQEQIRHLRKAKQWKKPVSENGRAWLALLDKHNGSYKKAKAELLRKHQDWPCVQRYEEGGDDEPAATRTERVKAESAGAA